ncbi:hypothetical protein JCM5353_002310 [Sporobolomyces roseus]
MSELDSTSQYGYVPSLSYGGIFIGIFAITSIIHTVQVVVTRRMWFMIFMICGGLGELIGWIMRLYSHWEPQLQDPYIGQLAVLVIAPTFYSAMLYWSLGVIIQLVAPQHSLLSARNLKIFFLVADFVSLIVQAVGGGIAGSAITQEDLDLGSRIMLGGIAFQLLVMIIYVAYGGWWGYKARREVARSGKDMQYMLYALAAASACIIARGIFRTIELEEGFSGYLAVHEQYILVDAIPVAACSYILNIIHPAKYLKVDNYARTPDMNLSESTFAPVDPQLQEKRTSAGNV